MQQNNQLFPGHSISYALPDGFEEADSKLFYPDNFEDQIPAVEMFVLEDVSLINGFLIQGNNFLDEFSHHANANIGSKWKSFLRLKVFPQNNLNLAIWGVQDWADNYFHWVTELMPRILAMHKTNKEVPVLLSEKVSRLSFVKQIMELFRIPFKVLPVGRGVKIDRLLACKVPHVGRFNQYLLGDFRSKVFQELGYNNNVIPFRKLYITRKSARRRKITNEQNILDEIKNWDFEQVTLEDLAWAEQIKLFSESKVVVSNHGAGLSNIMFMKAGTIVIELKAFNNDYWCYFSLARIHNLRYSYILCNSSDIDHRNADISVDMNILGQKLKNSEVLSV